MRSQKTILRRDVGDGPANDGLKTKPVDISLIAGAAETENVAAKRAVHWPRVQASGAEPSLYGENDYRELDISFDRHDRVLWYHMNPRNRPSFTLELLQDIRRFQVSVDELFAETAGGPSPIRYLVLSSNLPGIFNLGGDLRLLAEMIRDGNYEGLRTYAQACIDVLYPNAVNLNQPLVTISLVQGDALGGGFEAALSSNVLIAERSAKFGLPEVLFNLFPGMGAYSFLSRRIGGVAAEKLIFSGKIHSAEDLHKAGIVDILVEDGEGEEAVYDFVEREGRRFNAHRAVYQTRQCVNPVTLEELTNIAKIWVDAATRLEKGDLRRIDRLAASQDRRWKDALAGV